MAGLTRGTVLAAATRDGRVVLDVRLRTGEVRSRVGLLLPTGLTVIPRAGDDVLVGEVGQGRDHLVALVADAPAQRATGLAPGDWAVRDSRGQAVLLLPDRVEIANAQKIVIASAGEVVVTAPTIRLGGTGAVKRVKLEDDSAATKVYAQ